MKPAETHQTEVRGRRVGSERDFSVATSVLFRIIVSALLKSTPKAVIPAPARVDREYLLKVGQDDLPVKLLLIRK
jgi:hypothetical protein